MVQALTTMAAAVAAKTTADADADNNNLKRKKDTQKGVLFLKLKKFQHMITDYYFAQGHTALPVL